MLYTPGGSVVLPAENSKGMLISTLLGACACTLTTASPKKTPKMATNLHVWFFITNLLHSITRQFLKNGLKRDFSRKGREKSQRIGTSQEEGLAPAVGKAPLPDLFFPYLCVFFAPLRLCVRCFFLMPNATDNITALLVGYGRGDKEALDKLMPIVYDELRRQAARYLRREQAGHTLQTTALIHEAYVRLVDQHNVQWQNRAHFFGIAAQMMRRILVDHARTKKRAKRGGSDVKVSLADATIPVKGQDLDVVALDEALNRLAEIDEQQSRVVELRFFSGLTVEETAEVMGISPATVKRDWSMAKAWLHREMSREI
jgi:RNA polymerase sigma factor (TIGR02999 family)